MATANNEFFEALAALEKERGLPEDYLVEKIKAAIVIAVKKDYEVEDDNVVVDIDPEIGAFRASLLLRLSTVPWPFPAWHAGRLRSGAYSRSGCGRTYSPHSGQVLPCG